MDNIETIPSPCFGCGACVAACPVHAIKMILNDEGFYIASVDEHLCIECKKCKYVCLKSGIGEAYSLKDGILFSAKSKNEKVVMQSSSGGVAYELSKWAIKKEMSVLGVIYDYEINRARSLMTTDESDLQRMQGSKYLQCVTEDTIPKIIPFLKEAEDNKIMIFATPCQAYGIASLLEQNNMRNRAIIVDFFCHGVPSYIVWERYLADLSDKIGNGKLKKVSFRDKQIGWHNFVMCIEGTKGKYQQNSEGDWFYRMYFDNIMLSKACFECPVRRMVSKADIRLGDCWGRKYQDREDGISAVLCLTDVGNSIVNQISDIEVLEFLDKEEVFNAQSVKLYDGLSIREKAFAYFKNNSDLRKTIRYYRRDFSYKHKIKLFIKEATSVLPDGFRATLRNIYRKI